MLMQAIKERERVAKPERTADPAGVQGKTPAGRQEPAAASALEAEIDAIARDLLRDVVEPDRPAIQALALRTARAIQKTMVLGRALDRVPGSRSEWDVFDRVVRLREAEDRVVQGGLLALDLLRDRQLEVRAELVGRRRREDARAHVH